MKQQEQNREQQREKRHREVNRAIGVLTLGLVITGAFQVMMASFVDRGQVLYEYTLIRMNIIIIIYFLVILWRSSMLAPWDRIEQ